MREYQKTGTHGAASSGSGLTVERDGKYSTEYRQQLFEATAAVLVKRGIGHAHLWALYLVHQREAMREKVDTFYFSLIDAVEEAEAQVHNKHVMDTVWENLPKTTPPPQEYTI